MLTICVCLIVGLGIADQPHAAKLGAAAVVGLGFVTIARTQPLARRAVISGLVLGVGQLGTHFEGGGIVPLGMIAGLLIGLPKAGRGPSWTKAALCLIAVLLALAVAETAQSGHHVDATVILTLGASLIAARWALVDSSEDQVAAAFLMLQVAGALCAVLVIVSYFRGASLISQTASEISNSIVTASGSTRGSGPWGSPNEAGMILSASILATLMRLSREGPDSSHRRFAYGTLLVAALALILTGSRASIFSAAAGAAALSFVLYRERPRVVILSVFSVALLYFVAVKSGTLTGRSLDLFDAHDPSSYYRHLIQNYVFSRIHWTQTWGYGFTKGVQLAPNLVVGTYPNVDEAWLYTGLCLGGLAVLAFLLLCIVATWRTLRVGASFAAAVGIWMTLTTVSENLFLDVGPCVAGILLLGGARRFERFAEAVPHSEKTFAHAGRPLESSSQSGRVVQPTT